MTTSWCRRKMALIFMALLLIACPGGSEGLSLKKMWEIMVSSNPELLGNRLRELMAKIQENSSVKEMESFANEKLPAFIESRVKGKLGSGADMDSLQAQIVQKFEKIAKEADLSEICLNGTASTLSPMEIDDLGMDDISNDPGFCILNNTRLSGTDIRGSRIRETRAATVLGCQQECLKDLECEYFIYFTKQHYQRYKHETCRLLREGGQAQGNQRGHMSGPKKCSDQDVEMTVKELREFLDSELGKMMDGRCRELERLHSIVKDNKMFNAVSLSVLVTPKVAMSDEDVLKELCGASEAEINAGLEETMLAAVTTISEDKSAPKLSQMLTESFLNDFTFMDGLIANFKSQLQTMCLNRTSLSLSDNVIQDEGDAVVFSAGGSKLDGEGNGMRNPLEQQEEGEDAEVIDVPDLTNDVEDFGVDVQDGENDDEDENELEGTEGDNEDYDGTNAIDTDRILTKVSNSDDEEESGDDSGRDEEPQTVDGFIIGGRDGSDTRGEALEGDEEKGKEDGENDQKESGEEGEDKITFPDMDKPQKDRENFIEDFGVQTKEVRIEKEKNEKDEEDFGTEEPEQEEEDFGTGGTEQEEASDAEAVKAEGETNNVQEHNEISDKDLEEATNLIQEIGRKSIQDREIEQGRDHQASVAEAENVEANAESDRTEDIPQSEGEPENIPQAEGEVETEVDREDEGNSEAETVSDNMAGLAEEGYESEKSESISSSGAVPIQNELSSSSNLNNIDSDSGKQSELNIDGNEFISETLQPSKTDSGSEPQSKRDPNYKDKPNSEEEADSISEAEGHSESETNLKTEGHSETETNLKAGGHSETTQERHQRRLDKVLDIEKRGLDALK